MLMVEGKSPSRRSTQQLMSFGTHGRILGSHFGQPQLDKAVGLRHQTHCSRFGTKPIVHDFARTETHTYQCTHAHNNSAQTPRHQTQSSLAYCAKQKNRAEARNVTGEHKNRAETRNMTEERYQSRCFKEFQTKARRNKGRTSESDSSP